MLPLRDKRMSTRVYLLTVYRVILKLLILGIALFLHVNTFSFLLILMIFFLSELYKNIAILMINKYGRSNEIGALVSALDGAVLIFALYFANALNTDLYLFIAVSIALNTAEYGLLSAIVEGIVAGFSYAVFIIANLGGSDPSIFFSDYLIRVTFLVFLGWITGWLANDLSDKEKQLKLVIENDIHEEELNEVKDAFMSDAAENLKTPISAIKGYVDIMLNGRVGNLETTTKEYLQSISKNVMKIDSVSRSE